MKHVDMRKLPAAAQEERRRQVIGLRQAGLTYQPVDKVAQHLVDHIILGTAIMPDHYMMWGMSGPLTLSTGC
jgi:hypothetical protein